MHSILVSVGGGMDPDALKILSDLGDVTVIEPKRDALLQALTSVTVLIAGLDVPVTAEVLAAAPNLNIVATPATGTDHIDMAACKKRGITVLNLRGDAIKDVTGTAELAAGLMIALLRKIPSAFSDVQSGAWNRLSFIGHSLSGKTLGIVGVGRLGCLMARYGQAFGMNVIGFDRDPRSVTSFTPVAFDDLLEKSDVISLHVPLTPETEGMFNAKVFSTMKPGAVLINTARGKIINESDLIDALTKNQLAGYATDVLADELSFNNGKVPSDHPLIAYAKRHDNVMITPHIGGMTVEGRKATDVRIAEQIRDAVTA